MLYLYLLIMTLFCNIGIHELFKKKNKNSLFYLDDKEYRFYLYQLKGLNPRFKYFTECEGS